MQNTYSYPACLSACLSLCSLFFPHSFPWLAVCLSVSPPRVSLSQTVFHGECMFRESLLANNYNAYESVPHPTSYIALNRHGRVRRGDRATTAMTVTHFLPRI